MDIELARANMIESQVRTWEVLDQRILDLLSEVKRERFVPPAHRNLAFADMEIPLGHGEVMLAPKLEARMIQSLGLKSADRVLEVGTGTGFTAALMARLCAHVYSVELIPELAAAAAATLAAEGVRNVTVEQGNAAIGWPRHAPYDAIVLTGSVPLIPEELKQQLAPGGRLLAVVGRPPIMTAILLTQVGAGVFSSEGLFETSIPPLRQAREPERFVF